MPLLHINVILTRALIIFKLFSQSEHYPLFPFSHRNQTENWSVIKHPTQNCMISCINSTQTNSPNYTWSIFFYDPQCWHYFIRNNDLYNNWVILSIKIKCSAVCGRLIFLPPFISAHSMFSCALYYPAELILEGKELTWHKAAWMMQPSPGTRRHSRGKVAEDRKLTSAVCAEPKWLWAGVQHGQVESSWHRRASRALFVTVNNNCFLTIRVGQECTASQSLTFSPNLSNLRERSCVKTDGKIFCVCRLQETIGILQEPLTLSDMEGTHSKQSNDYQLCLLKEPKFIFIQKLLHILNRKLCNCTLISMFILLETKYWSSEYLSLVSHLLWHQKSAW